MKRLLKLDGAVIFVARFLAEIVSAVRSINKSHSNRTVEASPLPRLTNIVTMPRSRVGCRADAKKRSQRGRKSSARRQNKARKLLVLPPPHYARTHVVLVGLASERQRRPREKVASRNAKIFRLGEQTLFKNAHASSTPHVRVRPALEPRGGFARGWVTRRACETLCGSCPAAAAAAAREGGKETPDSLLAYSR
jgi:hypothetical protein